mmetsp:Transcript_27910/g.58949  ORF Transcript_27910/g.58949 Transcript_27910/m.58949 type:complete len:342 (+) Transcript_27910:188-1213(+)
MFRSSSTAIVKLALFALLSGTRALKFSREDLAKSLGQQNAQLLRSTGTENAKRKLLPHPHHHHEQGSKQYQGCLGLSEEEREEAWNFQGEIVPCTILVDGIVVVEADGSTVGSSPGNGDGSSSGSPNESVSGISGTESSNGEDGDGTSRNGNNGVYDSNSSGSSQGNDDTTSSGSTYEGNGRTSNEEDGDGESSPLQYFNISECETFSHMWIWDLALSCGDGFSTSLEDCECTAAEILYQYGKLDCPGTLESPPCPDNCPVCNTCMSLLGCSLDGNQDENRLIANKGTADKDDLPIVVGVAAAVLVFVVGVSTYMIRKRSIDNGSLNAEFLGLDPPATPVV